MNTLKLNTITFSVNKILVVTVVFVTQVCSEEQKEDGVRNEYDFQSMYITNL